jgi:hypothetical protein
MNLFSVLFCFFCLVFVFDLFVSRFRLCSEESKLLPLPIVTTWPVSVSSSSSGSRKDMVPKSWFSTRRTPTTQMSKCPKISSPSSRSSRLATTVAVLTKDRLRESLISKAQEARTAQQVQEKKNEASQKKKQTSQALPRTRSKGEQEIDKLRNRELRLAEQAKNKQMRMAKALLVQEEKKGRSQEAFDQCIQPLLQQYATAAQRTHVNALGAAGRTSEMWEYYRTTWKPWLTWWRKLLEQDFPFLHLQERQALQELKEDRKEAQKQVLAPFRKRFKEERLAELTEEQRDLPTNELAKALNKHTKAWKAARATSTKSKRKRVDGDDPSPGDAAAQPPRKAARKVKCKDDALLYTERERTLAETIVDLQGDIDLTDVVPDRMRTFRVRLAPTKAQRARLWRYAGGYRASYNGMVAMFRNPDLCAAEFEGVRTPPLQDVRKHVMEHLPKNLQDNVPYNIRELAPREYKSAKRIAWLNSPDGNFTMRFKSLKKSSM